MRPTTCPACRGDDLIDVDLGQRFFVGFIRLGHSRSVACLGCGVITQWLDYATLGALRAKAGHAAKPAPDDREP